MVGVLFLTVGVVFVWHSPFQPTTHVCLISWDNPEWYVSINNWRLVSHITQISIIYTHIPPLDQICSVVNKTTPNRILYTGGSVDFSAIKPLLWTAWKSPYNTTTCQLLLIICRGLKQWHTMSNLFYIFPTPHSAGILAELTWITSPGRISIWYTQWGDICIPH